MGPLLSGTYYVALLTVGTYVMLNLVVTAVIAGVHEASDAQKKSEVESAPARKQSHPVQFGTGGALSALRRALHKRRRDAFYVFGHKHPVRQFAEALLSAQICKHRVLESVSARAD